MSRPTKLKLLIAKEKKIEQIIVIFLFAIVYYRCNLLTIVGYGTRL